MSNIRKISHKAEKIAKGFDQPTEHLQSEGEILIKNLVQKQTNTKTSLNEQLSNKKEFVSPQDLVQITDYKVGETSLEEFKQTSEHLNLIENLKFSSLTSKEIDFYLDSLKGDHFLQTKYKNLSKDILDSRIKEIKAKIENKNSRNESVLTNHDISRLKKELASSIKPESQETKLFNFAISNLGPREDKLPLEHPINSLKTLEKELFSHLDRDERPSFAKRRKIMKKLEWVQSSNSYTPESNLKPKSKWDKKDLDLSSEIKMWRSSHAENIALAFPNLENCTKNKIYTCQTPTYYTVKDGRIVKLDKKPKEKEDLSEESLEKKTVVHKSLSDDEIRQIPKFKNYERCTPSKVLYVKNIPKNGKDEFLDLFRDFNSGDEQPEIKIMTEKMHGQAFVTFKNENLATDALNRYNGYYIKKKPIVISYGKSIK